MLERHRTRRGFARPHTLYSGYLDRCSIIHFYIVSYIHVLVELGLDLNSAPTPGDFTVFEYCVSQEIGRVNNKVVDFLVNTGLVDLNNDRGYALRYAVRFRLNNVVRTLISAGADIELAIVHEGNVDVRKRLQHLHSNQMMKSLKKNKREHK